MRDRQGVGTCADKSTHDGSLTNTAREDRAKGDPCQSLHHPRVRSPREDCAQSKGGNDHLGDSGPARLFLCAERAPRPRPRDECAEELASSTVTSPTPRQRKRVKLIGGLVTGALVIAYVAVLLTYQRSLSGELTEPQAPASALAIEIVPTQVLPVERQIRVSILLFPSDGFLDAEGRLEESITVVVSPTVANTEIAFTQAAFLPRKRLCCPSAGSFRPTHSIGTTIE